MSEETAEEGERDAMIGVVRRKEDRLRLKGVADEARQESEEMEKSQGDCDISKAYVSYERTPTDHVELTERCQRDVRSDPCRVELSRRSETV